MMRAIATIVLYCSLSVAQTLIAAHPRRVYLQAQTIDTTQTRTLPTSKVAPQSADFPTEWGLYLLHFDSLRIPTTCGTGHTALDYLRLVFNTTVSYIPSSTFLVLGTHLTLQQLLIPASDTGCDPRHILHQHLLWVNHFESEYKFNKTTLRKGSCHSTPSPCDEEDYPLLLTIATPSEDMAASKRVAVQIKQLLIQTVFGADTASAENNLLVFPASPTLIEIRSKVSTKVTLGQVVSTHPYVRWCEPQHPLSPWLQNAVTYIQGDVESPHVVWDNDIMGQDEVITISDTGVDWTSCWFRHNESDGGSHSSQFTAPPIGDSNKWLSGALTPNLSARKVVGIHVQCVEGDPSKCNDQFDVESGHGTSVAGSAVGTRHCPYTATVSQCNLDGAGMAPKAQLFFEDMAKGDSAPRVVAYDLLFTVPHKVSPSRIFSNSWGSTSPNYDFLTHHVDTFVWEHPDVLVLFAAGNLGACPDSYCGEGSVPSPAVAKNVLTVGATFDEDGTEVIASFSSYGPTPDGRIKPDIVAPGKRIRTPRSGGQGNVGTCNDHIQHGTSISTPIVAGAAALIRQYIREGRFADQEGKKTVGFGFKPSGNLIKALLLLSGDTLLVDAFTDSAGTAQTRIPTPRQGFGRVNLLNVLFPSRRHNVWFSETKLGPKYLMDRQRTNTYCINVVSRNKLKIVLTWNDPPPTLGVSQHVIGGVLRHNLDLVVWTVGDRLYRGNMLETGEYDSTNNVEIVEIETPVTGTYNILVHFNSDVFTFTGTSENDQLQRQPYTLAISGDFEPEVPCDSSCPTDGFLACSGNGDCSRLTKTCTCITRGTITFTHVDCSVYERNGAPLPVKSIPASHQCNGNGVWIDGSMCICYSDPIRGFAAGPDCLQCPSGFIKSATGACVHELCTRGGEWDDVERRCVCEEARAGQHCHQCATRYSGSDCRCIDNCQDNGWCSPTGCSCYQNEHDGYWVANVLRRGCLECQDSYFSPELQCKYSKRCSRRGVYNTLSRQCECFPYDPQDSTSGAWAPPGCGSCIEGWTGTKCRCDNPYCNHNGVCADDGCRCNFTPKTGYWQGTQNCTSCATGWYGEGCKCSSPDCNGHGECTVDGCHCYNSDLQGHFASTNFNETCENGHCQPEWEGDSCKCHRDGFGILCSGHGECVAEGCKCFRSMATGYWQSSISGTLVDCEHCLEGFEGPNKAREAHCKCYRDDAGLCSTHGKCSNTGCVCDQSPDSGFWISPLIHWFNSSSRYNIGDMVDVPMKLPSGGKEVRTIRVSASCDMCHQDYHGLDNSKTSGCKCYLTTQECSGHGKCLDSGCACFRSFATGWFEAVNATGTDCGKCLAQYATWPNCKCSSTACDGRGECFEDGCVCHNDTKGHFTSIERNNQYTPRCDLCQNGWSGPSCLCSDDTCDVVTAYPDRDQTTDCGHPHQCTISLPSDGLSFVVILRPGFINVDHMVTLRFYNIPIESASHPTKSTPAGMIYMQSTFSLQLAVPLRKEETGVAQPLSKLTTQQQHSDNEIDVFIVHEIQGLFKFQRYVELVMVYPTEAEAQSFIDDTDTFVDFQTNPPVLMWLDIEAWKPAHDLCPPEVQLLLEQQYNTTENQIKIRICEVYAGTQFALFAVVKPKDNRMILYIMIIAICVGSFLVGITVVGILRRRLKKVQQDRAAKEAVIKYITGRKKGKGESLRKRLGLKATEKFTKEIAAERLTKFAKAQNAKMEFILANRGLLAVVQPAGHLNPVNATIGAAHDDITFTFNSTATEDHNLAAVSSLALRDPPATWQFEDHEYRFLSACKTIRSMFTHNPFTKEYTLKVGALPEMQMKLVELQMELDFVKKQANKSLTSTNNLFQADNGNNNDGSTLVGSSDNAPVSSAGHPLLATSPSSASPRAAQFNMQAEENDEPPLGLPSPAMRKKKIQFEGEEEEDQPKASAAKASRRGRAVKISTPK